MNVGFFSSHFFFFCMCVFFLRQISQLSLMKDAERLALLKEIGGARVMRSGARRA